MPGGLRLRLHLLGSAVTVVIIAVGCASGPSNGGGGGGNCDPSYAGECLDPNASDYDCAGGSGNGPEYVYGTVQVVGDDHYGLDGDGDGAGCE
jgi:hypothetical protein